MKELSTKEKAQRYEEAINVARSKIKNDKDHVLYEEDIADIFPELKEDNDEKIRKYILKCCEETIEANDRGLELSMDTTKKLKNWLERQGCVKESVISQHENKTCRENNGSLTSEDEKIRKQILSFLKEFEHDHYRSLDFSSWIAWVEKQGTTNKKTEHKFSIGDIISNGKVVYRVDDIEKNSAGKDCYFLVDIKREKDGIGYDTLYNSKRNPHNSGEITWLCDQVDVLFKKQGEQKSTDKVEPKFHEGEWVVWDDKYYKVNYNGCGYELIDQYGLHTSLEYGTVDENAHIFCITDAKDGDILVYDGEIFMIKSCVLWNKIVYHCCYDGEILHRHSIYDSLERDDFDKVHPATKEQRCALMKAMSDAGWQFNFERKELKKIESDLTEFENALADVCRGWIGEELGWKDYIIKNSLPLLELAKKQFDEYEQKPTWSEEDEQNLNTALSYIKDEYLRRWLKDAIHNKYEKPAWREEDETRLTNTIIMLKEGANYHFIKDDITKAVDWLKFIKQRMGG